MKIAAALSLLAALFIASCSTSTEGRNATVQAQGIVDKAKGTLAAFSADPELAYVNDSIGVVKGIIVFPSVARGGFIFGGSGGTGVLLARDAASGAWSYPSFHSVGSLTFGLQIGGEVSEVILLLMTDDALDAMLTTAVRAGGDVSVAAGPIGAGAKAQVADILAYSRSKGLYAGINLEGAVIEARDDLNDAYYSAGTRPRDIIFKGTARNPGAEPLREALKAYKR